MAEEVIVMEEETEMEVDMEEIDMVIGKMIEEEVCLKDDLLIVHHEIFKEVMDE